MEETEKAIALSDASPTAPLCNGHESAPDAQLLGQMPSSVMGGGQTVDVDPAAGQNEDAGLAQSVEPGSGKSQGVDETPLESGTPSAVDPVLISPHSECCMALVSATVVPCQYIHKINLQLSSHSIGILLAFCGVFSYGNFAA